MYLVYMDGRYRAWTRQTAMTVRPGDTADHAFSVVAKDDQGRRSAATSPVTGRAAA